MNLIALHYPATVWCLTIMLCRSYSTNKLTHSILLMGEWTCSNWITVCIITDAVLTVIKADMEVEEGADVDIQISCLRAMRALSSSPECIRHIVMTDGADVIIGNSVDFVTNMWVFALFCCDLWRYLGLHYLWLMTYDWNSVCAFLFLSVIVDTTFLLPSCYFIVIVIIVIIIIMIYNTIIIFCFCRCYLHN